MHRRTFAQYPCTTTLLLSATKSSHLTWKLSASHREERGNGLNGPRVRSAVETPGVLAVK